MLGRAIEDEVAAYLGARDHLVDESGRRLVVRNGHLPGRSIQTPMGEISVKQPRVRDRRDGAEREGFQSSILPPYLRKTKSLEDLLPWLYLKGISTGDFSEALQALLGPDSPGLSASTITRLKAGWEQEYKDWSKRSLKSKRYVYVWADGVHFNVRLEDPGNARQCILVLIKTKGSGSRIACLTMVFKLALSAQKRWRTLNGAKLLGEVIDGVVFEDGERKEAA
jgi:transposase-like protein